MPTINGTAGNDNLAGTSGADIIYGLEGDDTIDGAGGADEIHAGSGNDTIIDNTGQDYILAEDGDDHIVVTVTNGTGAIHGQIGNDTVDLTVNGTANGNTGTGFYGVILDEGNDVLNVHSIHLTSGRIFAVTGAGSDTVHLTDDFTPATIEIGDFQAGAGGDVLDVMPFINAYLPAHGINWTPGNDPFEGGFLQLTQEEDHATLWFNPNGTLDSSSTAIVLFEGSAGWALTDMVAENFGGLNFLASVSPTETRVVTHSYAVAFGQTVAVDDPDEFAIAQWNLPTRALFVYQSHGTAPQSFENFGSIEVTNAAPTGTYGLAGFAVSRYSGTPDGASFINEAGASFIVTNSYVFGAATDLPMPTFGFYAPQQAIDFYNRGYFEVSAADGEAYGFYGVGGDRIVSNDGTIAVSAAEQAYGVYSSGSNPLSNSGNINVYGGLLAFGVYWGSVNGSYFNNSGTIVATTNAASPYASVGVYLWESSSPTASFDHYNSGTITADIAIWVDYIDGVTEVGWVSDHLHNSGTINGAVLLGTGDDILENSGTISGRTLLEEGNDRYDGSTGVHLGTVEGGTGDDVLVGGFYTDFFYGDEGDDTLTGNAGDDILDGGSGNDTLSGGNGLDAASYSEASAGVTVSLATTGPQNTLGAGIDTLSGIEDLLGSALDDRLTGSSFGNVLFGLGGDDVLTGLGGNDELDGGTGADVMRGGLGNDTYYVDSGSDLAVEYAGEGTDLAYSSVSYRLREDVENLTLTGSGAINATGNALSNRLVGNSGANILDGAAGADIMRGGFGNDTYYVDNSGDSVVELGGQGTDSVFSSITYKLTGNVENLTLTGTAVRATGNTLANVIVGNAVNNVINGGFGDDIMLGGAGNDIYFVFETGDSIIEFGGEGRDRIDSTVTYTISSNVEDLFLRGASAIDGIGNALDNLISGNSANNVLDGRGGADDLRGGNGADTFVFRDGEFGGLTPSTADRIIDFSQAQGDHIDLSAVDANTLVGGDQAFSFIGTAAFTHVAGELRYQQLGANTYVYGDTDGDGVADFMIRVDGLHTLVLGDFGI